jgi:hypothetical protein
MVLVKAFHHSVSLSQLPHLFLKDQAPEGSRLSATLVDVSERLADGMTQMMSRFRS